MKIIIIIIIIIIWNIHFEEYSVSDLDFAFFALEQDFGQKWKKIAFFL